MVNPPRPSVNRYSDEMLLEVASLYYVDGWDQVKIAKRVSTSRSTVSRIIAEARRLGIVEIRINRPRPVDNHLRREAMERFGLREAFVLNVSRNAEGTLQQVAAMAAAFLEGELDDGATLAIAWGSSIAATADALRGDVRRGVTVVQMLGASGSVNPKVDGAELARIFARRLGGSFLQLNAPLLVDDADLARALLRQRPLANVLDRAAAAQVALIGLGAMAPEVSSLLRAGFVSQPVLARAVEAGVVGDACGLLLDADGNTSGYELATRFIGLDEKRLRAIPTVIAVAAGLEKVAIIRAALLGGLLDVLATDSETMRAVLAATGQR